MNTSRWWVIAAVAMVAALAVVGRGTWHGEGAEPSLDLAQLVPNGPAVHEPRTCTRTDTGRATAEEIRRSVPAGAWVTSEVVTACPEAFDHRRIRYVGEVVGDLLRRDGGAWARINDDAYAIQVGPLPVHREPHGSNRGLAVWLPEELVDAVEQAGRPGYRGDAVQVTGTLLRADPADGGGLTLRASALEVLAAGHAIDEPLDVPQLALAAAASLVAVGLWGARRRDTRTERRRRR